MKRSKARANGFTLIEIMVATAITMMIIGSVYAAFRSSLNAYQRTETHIIMLQRCRTALDRMSRDISNLFYVSGDDEMTMFVEDFSDNETTMDTDMISFVAIVNPNLRNYEPSEESRTNLDGDEENNLPTDLARIIYYIGPNPDDKNVQCLMRVVTTNLDPEEAQTLLEELMSSSNPEEMAEDLQSSILVDNVSGLNIRYFDGTEWADTWDMEEEGGLPIAVEITLSVLDADKGDKTLTEAVVIYLPMSKPLESSTGTGQQQQQIGM